MPEDNARWIKTGIIITLKVPFEHVNGLPQEVQYKTISIQSQEPLYNGLNRIYQRSIQDPMDRVRVEVRPDPSSY